MVLFRSGILTPYEHSDAVAPEGWRKIFVEKGPEAFAKAVRAHKGFIFTYLLCLPYELMQFNS